MNIVRHNEDGVIISVTMQAEMGVQTLSDRYTEMGIPHILYDGDVDITSAYVKDGQVLPKPPVQVVGEVRPVKADGADTLVFSVTPAEFDVVVLLDGLMVHQEHCTTGQLEFSVDHAGAYAVFLSATHPYAPKRLDIEATA